MLSVREVRSSYGRIEVLHGISMDVAPGEVVVVIGANGAGKTTLMRLISGVQPISGGEVRFLGDCLSRRPAHQRVGLGIAQVPEGRQIFGPLTVEENLHLGAWSRRPRDAAFASSLRWVFDAFPVLEQMRHRQAGSLSGGQQQMLAIGRAMMSRPKMLLLDEPSMGLAPQIVAQIFASLSELKKQGMTILLVEQNVNAALRLADRAYVLETGAITLQGSAQSLAADPRVREAYLGH